MARLNELLARKEALAKQRTDLQARIDAPEYAPTAEESAQDVKAAQDLAASISANTAEFESRQSLNDAARRSDDVVASFRGDGTPATAQDHGPNTAKAPWSSFGEQLQAVAHAAQAPHDIDPRLFRAASGMSEGIGPDGGYLVAPEYSNELLVRAMEATRLAQRCYRRRISGNQIVFNAIDETSRVAGSRWGGVQVYRDSEAGSVTAAAPKFRQIKIDLLKLTGLAYATEELLEDAVALESIVGEAFQDEFGFKIDDEIINGTGAGQFQGLITATATVSVAKEAGQTAATVVFANVKKMRARMWAPARANAIWLINQEVEPELDGMSMPVGTGGVPVFMPANGISGKPFDTLYGMPLIPMEQCAALGTVGDIILVDPSQYIIIDNGDVQTTQSMHVRFINGENTYRFRVRNNGQPKWRSALTPARGTNTLSPYVTLATRS